MNLEQYSDPIRRVYAECVDRIIANIAKHFNVKATGPTGTFEWQALKLAELGQMNRETIKIIAQTVGDPSGMTDLALEQAMRATLKKTNAAMNAAGIQSLNGAEGRLSTPMQNILRYYGDQAKVQMNLVNTVMLTDSLNGYRRVVSSIANTQSVLREVTQGILNTMTGEVVSGVSSYTQAVRQAVTEMAHNGIVGFIDKAGHRWEPDAYAAMDIRTTTNNVAREAVFQQSRESADGLIIWPTNATARPGCAPWQGKVCSLNGFSGYVLDGNGLQVRVYPIGETSYGQPAGIGGINCHHTPPDPFYANYSINRPREVDPEASAQRYEQTQRQRYLEREVRAAKREALAQDAAGDTEGFAMAAKRVKQKQAALNDFIGQTGLTPRNDRTQVYGYGHSTSGKATQAARRAS